MSAALALLSSALWGTGDFLGGVASRRFGALRVLAWSQLATVLLIWSIIGGATIFGAVSPELRAVLIGAAGGAAGVLALLAFYRALAIGPMAVVPPIAAAGVVLPIGVGLAAAGELPSARTGVGLLVAVAGVVLASLGESASTTTTASGGVGASTRVAPSTIGLCLLAAVGFALVFVALDAAAGASPGAALVATGGVRLGGAVTLLLTVALRRTDLRTGIAPRDVARFAGIGMFDTGANLTFAVATALGRLEVVAVLGSLYPAVTSGLAQAVLGERPGRLQLAGVVLALIGVGLLAVQ